MYKPGDRVRVILRGAPFSYSFTDDATVVSFQDDEYTVLVDHPKELAGLEDDTVQHERYIGPDDDGNFTDIQAIDDTPQPTAFLNQ